MPQHILQAYDQTAEASTKQRKPIFWPTGVLPVNKTGGSQIGGGSLLQLVRAEHSEATEQSSHCGLTLTQHSASTYTHPQHQAAVKQDRVPRHHSKLIVRSACSTQQLCLSEHRALGFRLVSLAPILLRNTQTPYPHPPSCPHLLHNVAVVPHAVKQQPATKLLLRALAPPRCWSLAHAARPCSPIAAAATAAAAAVCCS